MKGYHGTALLSHVWPGLAWPGLVPHHAHQESALSDSLLGRQKRGGCPKGSVRVLVGTAGPCTSLSFRNKIFTSLVLIHWGKEFFRRKSGTVVPLLTEALFFFVIRLIRASQVLGGPQGARFAQDYKIMSNSPAYTPEHKSTCNSNCTHTLTPKFTAPAACTKLQTTFPQYWNRKIHGSKKNPHKAETWGTVLEQARVRPGGGLVWFGSRPVPDALAHGQHSPLCRHDWARRIAVVRSQGLPDC